MNVRATVDQTPVRARRRTFLRTVLPPAIRRSPLAITGLVIVAAWVALAVFAPWIAPYKPLTQDIVHRLQPPSGAHILGTDALGRDIFTRILYGARISIAIGFAAVVLAASVGTVVGTIAGLSPNAVDETIMRVNDLMLSFPTVILAMVISAALGAGMKNAVIAIMVAWWPLYARLVRGLVLAQREREYVLAATAMGASRAGIARRHVLRNIVAPIIIMGSLDIGRAILLFATLSFLGLGAPPEMAEWGAMVASGRNYFEQWWISGFPGLAILTLVLAFNVVGDSLRDYLDPRTQAR